MHLQSSNILFSLYDFLKIYWWKSLQKPWCKPNSILGLTAKEMFVCLNYNRSNLKYLLYRKDISVLCVVTDNLEAVL